MSIKKIEVYRVVCDPCGARLDVTGSERDMQKELDKQGWSRSDWNTGCVMPVDLYRTVVKCKECIEKERLKNQQSEDFETRLYAGAYDSTEGFKKFQKDALAHLGLSKHVKADKLYAVAYEEGHSAGACEIYAVMQRLMELID